jgi:hypothetical protein
MSEKPDGVVVYAALQDPELGKLPSPDAPLRLLDTTRGRP